jgi:hypothetical protein
MQMLHRENASIDSPNPLVDTLRDSLIEINKIKSRLTDLQEQLSDVLMQMQITPPQSTIPIAATISDRVSITPQSTQPGGVVASGVVSPINTESTISLSPPPSVPSGDDGSGGQVADSIDLQKWLLDRGVSIRQFVSESPFEESFDRLALRLGRDFEYLSDFYQALKRRIGGSTAPKSIALKNYTGDKITRVVQFGEELRRNGFLKEFRYVRGTRTILFDPQTDGRVANFITGNWLERYVVITVSQHLRRLFPGRTIEVLTNPRVTLPDGSDFELDVLIACDSIVLWFECKTGKDYPAYLAKYGVVAKKVMQLGCKNAAMILLEELTDLEKSNNSQLAGMSVLNLKDVQRFLDSVQPRKPGGQTAADNIVTIEQAETLQPVPPAPTAQRVPPQRMNFTDWMAVLNREQLRPLDAMLRRQIIEGFTAISSSASEPIPLRNAVNSLAAQYVAEGLQVSKAMINDIARALYRSGCCELGLHSDYPNKVWFLRNDLVCADAFNATGSLYLWAGIKARERFQVESPEAVELARVICGGHVIESDATDFVRHCVLDMETAGRCLISSVDDQHIVTAIGERFWDQPEEDGDEKASPEAGKQ